MSDAQLAIFAGLLGVGLSGGVQVWLAVWQSAKDRRVVVRLMEDEMGNLVARLASAISRATVTREDFDHTWTETLLPSSESAYPALRERLSREVSRGVWTKVQSAYRAYDVVQTYARAAEETEAYPLAQTIVVLAHDAIDDIERARVSLAPWRNRPKAWLKARKFKQHRDRNL